MDYYTAKYSDAYGSEVATITNDGESLRVVLRGIEFAGPDFDSLSPADTLGDQPRRFSLHDNCLCSCRIECQIQIPVYDEGRQATGELFIDLTLGDPAPNGALDQGYLKIVLEYNGRRFSGSGKSGWFEDELLEIQAQLPVGVYMQACINCLYSDYSPYGHGLFGWMMCFRNLKDEYTKVTSKAEFWSVHDRYDRLVQEIYLCSDFKRRVPGTGYRG
jgi:hypothetical protein